MNNDLAEILEELQSRGYDSISPNEDRPFPEASGNVSLLEKDRREPRTGWRRFLPRIYWNAGDPDLIPDDLQAVVEEHDWVVQAMGRDDDTVNVVISEGGV